MMGVSSAIMGSSRATGASVASGAAGGGGATGVGATGSTGPKGDPGSPGGATGATGIFPDYLPNPIKERTALSTSSGGAIPIYLKDRQVYYFSEGIASNFNFVFTADASSNLDTILNANDSISVTIFVKATSSTRVMSKPTITGASSTPEVYSYSGLYYQSGVGKMEVYSFAIIRNAANITYTVFSAQSEAVSI